MKKIIKEILPFIEFAVFFMGFALVIAGMFVSQETIDENQTQITVTATVVDKNMLSKINTLEYLIFKDPITRKGYYIELEIENKYRDIVKVNESSILYRGEKDSSKE